MRIVCPTVSENKTSIEKNGRIYLNCITVCVFLSFCPSYAEKYSVCAFALFNLGSWFEEAGKNFAGEYIGIYQKWFFLCSVNFRLLESVSIHWRTTNGRPIGTHAAFYTYFLPLQCIFNYRRRKKNEFSATTRDPTTVWESRWVHALSGIILYETTDNEQGSRAQRIPTECLIFYAKPLARSWELRVFQIVKITT